jgi:alpha-beta hydrolase superfamily lysophospholipase
MMRRMAWAAALAMPGLAAPAAAAASPAQPFETTACPASVSGAAACYSGRDANGAWVLAAVPAAWNGRLVVHAHGGPSLGAPRVEESIEDLDRFAIMVRSGYAWVGSTYRRGGYGVRMAAADTDAARALFWSRFGRPARTILHGQSYGGNVAAKLAETGALDDEGRVVYDGVLVTNGVLAGGTRAYQFRADLRAVYQFHCRNHPRPDEPQYPVWQGLPAGAVMTAADLRSRVNACTGVDRPAGERTPGQSAALRDILAATGIAEKQLVRHMTWATFTMQDLVMTRLGGRNPFDNMARRYRGTGNDAALNAGVPRFRADPAAVARLSYDADLSGRIVVPTLTLKASGDPIIPYAQDLDYRSVVTAAGRADLLRQIFTDETDHSKMSDAHYMSALGALEAWIDSGRAPTTADIATRCRDLVALGPCRVLPQAPALPRPR